MFGKRANILITKTDDITRIFLSFSYIICSPVTVELISMMFVFVFDISVDLLNLVETHA